MMLLFILLERRILRSVDKKWNNQLRQTRLKEILKDKKRGKPSGLEFSENIAEVS